MGAAPVLTISRNGETIRSCSIEGEAMLGRAEGCVIRLEDRAISRHHAVFRVVADGVQVEKKSDFAPILVNGSEVANALLKDADVIHIGPYLLRLSVPKQVLPPPLIEAPAVGKAGEFSQAQSEEERAASAVVEGSDSSERGSSIDTNNAPNGDGGLLQPLAEGVEGASLGQPGMDFNAGGMGLPDGMGDSSPDAQALAGLSLGNEDAEVEQADDDAKTKLTPKGKLRVQLVFQPGTANVTDFELTKDEISIGRGKNCDIVLNDKKSSRKNSIIRRVGLCFTIKDLDSANGTYVNGVRVQEQELSGNDMVKIGGVDFEFRAMSADYSARQKDFMAVPEDPIEPSLPQMENPQAFMMTPGGGDGLEMGQANPAGVPGPIPGVDANVGIPGITGIGPGDLKRMGFIEKLKNFKSLPRKQQIIYGALVLALVYFIAFDDDPEPAKKAPKKKGVVAASGVTAPTGPATFESLAPEQKRFIEAQHSLAFDYYRNKEYDKSLFELGKIFAIIQDYKDSRDIERYAKEGRRKLEALEEEKRKKEEEARLKAKIQELVDECKGRMEKKQYEPARDLFSQITVLDPDNQAVLGWKKEIDEFEEKRKLEEQSRNVQEEINKRAWEVYNEALTLKKQGKYHSAIEVFGKVADVGASDKKVVSLAGKMIKACYSAIKGRRDPVLAEAKQHEDAGEFSPAFLLYKKATVIDPPHPAGYAGMARVRGVLHDRAKAIYTEAILAESYSDFVTAKKKFKECLEAAPADDIYHDRAVRKLGHYFRKDDP